MPKHSNLSLVVLFHFQLVLLELVDLVANEFHLLDLLRHLALHLFRGATLVVELGPKVVQDLIQAMIRWTRGSRAQIRVTAVLSSVEHGGRGVDGCEDGQDGLTGAGDMSGDLGIKSRWGNGRYLLELSSEA